jgi:alkylhydroperoxidase family enzyme
VAEDKGFSEQHVEKIATAYEQTDLDRLDKLVLRFADCFLTHPAGIDESLKADMRAHFSDEAIVEITAALGLFLGFSKIAIALGPLPDGLPVMQMPLPDLPAAQANGQRYSPER